MARKYRRDARGRFAGGGYSGQTSGRGARLKSGGNVRKGGGATIKAAGPKGTISKAPGRRPAPKMKPKGWAQNPRERADRVRNAAGRNREAAFLKSLPKPTRQAIRTASRSNSPVGAKYRTGVLDGATILRGNFGKRKNAMSPGRATAIADSIAFSGRKLRVAVAFPGVGRRLKPVDDQRKSQRGNIKAGKVGGTVRKPRGLKPGALKSKPQAPKQSAAPKFEKVSAGRRRAVLPSGRGINIADNGRQFSTTLVGKDGRPRMSRRGFRNVSEAKRWARNPNARGPRLMGLQSEAAPQADYIRRKRSGPASIVRKPRSLKPQPVRASR